MSHHPEHMAGEHPWTDRGQIILLFVFLIVWVLDSFIFKFSRAVAMTVPLVVRLSIAAVLSMISAYIVDRAFEVFRKSTDGPRMVTDGVFAYMRHPMYFGTMLFFFALIILTASLFSVIVFTLMVIFYENVTEYEEVLLEQKFGDEYTEYKKRTAKWFPGTKK